MKNENKFILAVVSLASIWFVAQEKRAWENFKAGRRSCPDQFTDKHEAEFANIFNPRRRWFFLKPKY